MSDLDNKRQLLSWFNSSSTQIGLLARLKKHFYDLSAGYERKGLKREAKIFTNATEQIEKIEQEIRELSGGQLHVGFDR